MAGFSIRLYKSSLALALSVFIAALSMRMSSRSDDKLEDYAVSKGKIQHARIIDHHGNRSSYHELWITTSAGESFYLRYPDRKRLERYLAALQNVSEVTIRFQNDSDGHRIYDVRDDVRIFIPIEEIVAELGQRAKVGFVVAGALGILGILLMWMDRRKPRPKTRREIVSG